MPWYVRRRLPSNETLVFFFSLRGVVSPCTCRASDSAARESGCFPGTPLCLRFVSIPFTIFLSVFSLLSTPATRKGDVEMLAGAAPSNLVGVDSNSPHVMNGEAPTPGSIKGVATVTYAFRGVDDVVAVETPSSPGASKRVFRATVTYF